MPARFDRYPSWRWRSLREHLGEILVAASGQAHQVQIAVGPGQSPSQRMGRLQGRDDALQARDLTEGRERLTVGDGLIAGAATVAQVGVLGSGARVVKTGGDRVGLHDLALLVLHYRGQGPVQHSGATADGERGAVTGGVDSLATGLHADQLDLGVIQEGGEDAKRIGTTADTGHDAPGQAFLALEDLSARLVSDHTLQVAHQGRVGRGADDRADHIVGVSYVCHPVADRRRRRLLQGSCACVHRLDVGTQQFHALHVGCLAAGVLAAHVDHALEVQQGTHGGCGDTVLAGTGLGDDPLLAHALRQQGLPEGIVELVRTGVVEILALEVYGAAEALGETYGSVERSRASREVAQQTIELGPVGGILTRLCPSQVELGERGHQGLGDVLAAVASETVLDCAHVGEPTGVSARSTAAKNSRNLTGSLRPGACSVPLAVSTAYGWTRSTASPTFSGMRPPLRISGIFERRPASKPQSNVSPVPPRKPSRPGRTERASSR